MSSRHPHRRPPRLTRHRLIAPDSLRAEVLEIRDMSDKFIHEDYTPHTQIVFPVRGLCYIATAHREVFLDLNHVAIVPRDMTTKDRHPSFGDVACIVVTPTPQLLEEIWH